MTERKTYYLDLQTLLKLLRNKSGTLSCKVKMNSQWGNGLITLRRGQIEQSLIEWPGGRIEGKEAFEYLSAIEEWQVHFDENHLTANMSPSSPHAPGGPAVTPKPFSSGVHSFPPTPPSFSPAPPMRMSPSTSPIPRVRNQLNPFMLTHYTPEQRVILRAIYELVDGKTTIDQIKARINTPQETVDVALATLQHLGTIVW